jgi:hypothetical protein
VTPAWNAGEPRFVFYPPLSWTVGGMLGLALPWTLVPAAFTFLALLTAGLTMRSLAARWASPELATLVAVGYLANPYMLFTAYERTAYGELFAAAWMPLLLAAALAARVKALPVALALALLWLSNAPAAVMGSYGLAVLLAVRLLRERHRPRLIRAGSGGVALGLLLAAFYILPAAYEQRFVQISMAEIPGMRPSEHFLFHRMGTHSADDLFHDDVVRTASVLALLLLAGIAGAWFAAWRRREPFESTRLLLPIAILTSLIALLLTPLSLPLWNHVPKLAFLQFPWRLNALLAVLLATLLAMALRRARLAPPAAAALALLLAAALVAPSWKLFRQVCDDEDAVPARVALFRSGQGTEPTDEYTPRGVDADEVKPGDPPFWLLPETAGQDVDGGPPPGSKPGPAPDHLQLQVAAPEWLVLNRRAYPWWRIGLNGMWIEQPASLLHRPIEYRSLPPRPRRADGLIVLPLRPGVNTIQLESEETWDETAGFALSGTGAVAVLLLVRRRRRSSRLSNTL